MFSSHYDDALLSCSRRAAADAMRWRPGNAAERAFPSCPRCDSPNTKFCYYNNYSLSQPRYFCKGCRRYWTKGGSLRNVPVGGGSRRKTRRGHDFRRHTPLPQPPPPPPAAPPLRPDLLLHDDVANPAAHPAAAAACSSESSSYNQITPQPLIDEEILLDQAHANFNGYSDLSVDILPSTNGSNYLVHQGLEHINLGIINDEYWSSLDNYSSLIGGFL